MNPLAATTRLNGFGNPAVTIGLIVALAVLARGEPPRVETRFFNGKDLAGWKSADMSHWSVVDRAIVGRSEAPILKNDFLWCDVEVRDFYLSVQVKQIPFARNGGIQFRSRPKGTEALGYQADVGGEVWGNLHHEGGRLKLAAPVNMQKFLRKEEWNHYEILAVGHRIWFAINGQLVIAIEDPAGETSGLVAVQIHSGAPQEVWYKPQKLIHNPKVELAGLDEAQLVKALGPPLDKK